MNVLIVEDEPRLAELIARTFKRAQIDSTVRHDGQEALYEALLGDYDVIVLDRMLPSMDGLSILRELRNRRVHTPVLFLTALGDVPERVVGLGAGADDYLGKPFAFEELVARVQALARRSNEVVVDDLQRLGAVEVDLRRRTVKRDGTPVELTPKEFALLESLIRHKGKVLSREQILRRVWGTNADPGDNIVDLYVHYLRKKLDSDDAGQGSLIRTVRGVGYIVG